jgi:hypothetical protein
VHDFFGEDDLKTFEGWLMHQDVNAATIMPEEVEKWRTLFNEARERSLGTPKVGLMKLRSILGEHRYAVAVPEGSDLWLALWVKRSPKGEFFVMVPRGDREWDVHTSYHLDGTLHIKSYGHAVLSRKVQPLTGTFLGAQSVAQFSGYAPKSIGAVCDPAAFTGIVEVGPGILGPKHGVVAVDLVEPGRKPTALSSTKVHQEQVFRDFVPWLVIRVGSMLWSQAASPSKC